MEENNTENKEKTGGNSQQVAGAIIVAGIIIAGAIMLKGSSAPTPNTQVAGGDVVAQAFAGRPISTDDHIIGNQKAKIVIVEYSDLECPFCKSFHNTMHTVLENNDDVAWIYRHFPIPQLHSKAIREAEATECAWEQGGNNAFWAYTDRVFQVTTSNDGLPDSELPNIAQYIGLDVGVFTSCLESGKYSAKVQADVDDGSKAGVRGTPSSFILVDGKVVDTIPGALPYEAVIQKLDQIR